MPDHTPDDTKMSTAGTPKPRDEEQRSQEIRKQPKGEKHTSNHDATTTGVGFGGTPVVHESVEKVLEPKAVAPEVGNLSEKRKRLTDGKKTKSRANRKIRVTTSGPGGVGVPLDGKHNTINNPGGIPHEHTGKEIVTDSTNHADETNAKPGGEGIKTHLILGIYTKKSRT